MTVEIEKAMQSCSINWRSDPKQETRVTLYAMWEIPYDIATVASGSEADAALMDFCLDAF